MKTLYLPIIEPGAHHATALEQKHGLFDALRLYGDVLQWDYLANDAETRFEGLIIRLDSFQPDLVFTQFHAADVITPDQLRDLRQRYPHILWVNWSGDSWAWSLTAPSILELARIYDLWLVSAPDTLPTYAAEGVEARFMQIALEPVTQPLPEMPTYDVVFLGNVISEPRRRLLELLRQMTDLCVGIYGDWEQADGQNTYNFAEGEALYRNAIVAIADMAYPDQKNYISNRPFHVLAAGGALLLHQHVERMDILSGLVAGKHFIEWQTLDDLPYLIRAWVGSRYARPRARIVKAGQAFVLRNHTWERRVEQLMLEWLPEVKEKA